ncbi:MULTISPECIES: GNAT family N-acetyltransferase [Nocardia]|uniref:GNAT family N-acetyltransferase n=1 Tax=Nocardia TaxID=1817 RepID=UPI000D6895FB|nr:MULTISPECIES: GNAT family N-acetyltransferase [Nocardia]
MIEFRRYNHTEAREIRTQVLDVFTRSYVVAIESGDPFDSPKAFAERFDAYTRGPGFDLLVAYISGTAVGQAWGWPLSPASGWWGGLKLDDPAADHAAFTTEDGTRTFALSEIMVDAEHAGRGYARALHDELLRARTETRGTLLVEPDNEQAYAKYRRWGWSRVGTLTPHWDHAPTLDVLVRPLG